MLIISTAKVTFFSISATFFLFLPAPYLVQPTRPALWSGNVFPRYGEGPFNPALLQYRYSFVTRYDNGKQA